MCTGQPKGPHRQPGPQLHHIIRAQLLRRHAQNGRRLLHRALRRAAGLPTCTDPAGPFTAAVRIPHVVTAAALTAMAVLALHAQRGHDAFSYAIIRINLSGIVAGLRMQLVSAPWEVSMRLARRPSCHAAAMDLGSLCSSVCTLHR